MADKPEIAVTLIVIGAAFYIVSGLVVAAVVEGLGELAAYFGAKQAIAQARQTAMTSILTGVGVGIAIMTGGILACSGNRFRIWIGAILAVAFSLVGFRYAFGGLVIGPVLVIAGSVLAAIWRPEGVSAQPQQIAGETR